MVIQCIFNVLPYCQHLIVQFDVKIIHTILMAFKITTLWPYVAITHL